MLTAAYVHTAYWVWYVVSFNPALIKAGVEGIDDRIGLVGMGLAGFMNAGAAVYARHLVSEVELRNGIVKVAAHSLPFGRPDEKEGAEMYRVGEVLIPVDKLKPEEGIKMLRREGGYSYQPLKIQDKAKQGWRLSYLLDVENGTYPLGDQQAFSVLHRGISLNTEQLLAGAGTAGGGGGGEKKEKARFNPNKGGRRRNKNKRGD